MIARQIGSGEMYVGDCLDVMRSFPDRHVSMSICSPPYEDQRTYGVGYKLAGQTWTDWMAERVAEMCRVTDGLVFVNAAGPVRQRMYSPTMEWLVADLTRKHGVVCGPAPYVFHRVGIPGSGGKDYHRRDWEPVYAFAFPDRLPVKWSDNTAFGHPPKWAPGGAMSHRLSDGTRINQWGKTGSMTGTTATGNKEKSSIGKPRPSHKTMSKRQLARELGVPMKTTTSANGADGEPLTQGTYLPPAIANPGNVVQVLVGGGQMGHDVAHENEAPFPLDLPARFIAWFVPPTGRVLDPFMGSGTTAHAAEDAGRQWIGIDVRESQADLVARRLGTVTKALFS